MYFNSVVVIIGSLRTSQNRAENSPIAFTVFLFNILKLNVSYAIPMNMKSIQIEAKRSRYCTRAFNPAPCSSVRCPLLVNYG